jgi:hypothetical protein
MLHTPSTLTEIVSNKKVTSKSHTNWTAPAAVLGRFTPCVGGAGKRKGRTLNDIFVVWSEAHNKCNQIKSNIEIIVH